MWKSIATLSQKQRLLRRSYPRSAVASTIPQQKVLISRLFLQEDDEFLGRNLHCRRFSTSTTDPRIQAKPPNELNSSKKFAEDFEPKYPLPDKDKELELSKLQVQVQELFQAGQYPRALKAAETLLKETHEHFDQNHPATASAYNNVGLMHKLLGQFDKSRHNYTQALQIYQTTVGTDHASYAASLHNLGNLNRNQIHFDDTLRATDRLTLLETALEQLEQAYRIRTAELGSEHPHTVSSRSSWGATLAAQILHHYKATTTSTDDDDTKKREYLSLRPQTVTEQGWDLAMEHLRAALAMAIANPRGPSLATTNKKKKKNARKKTKRNANNKKEKQQQAQQQSSSSQYVVVSKTNASDSNLDNDNDDDDKIQTLSAASAAQNLAIFLKARATTTIEISTMTTTTDNNNTNNNQKQEWLQEAQQLYQDVMHVRTQLLPAEHPDIYATKHSLAELLDVMGDDEAAQAIRQEIVDSYLDDEDDEEEEKGQKTNKNEKG